MKVFSRTGWFGSLLFTLLLASCCAACLQRSSPDEPTYLLNHTVKVSLTYKPSSQARSQTDDGVGDAGAGAGAGAPDADLSPPRRITTASGSGSVVYARNTRSLVLTAAHVCDAVPAPVTITVRRVQGEELSSRIVWENKEQDLCVLVTDNYVGPAAIVADRLPPLGELVYFPGAPLGFFGNGVGFLEQGRYAGRATPGSGPSRLLIAGITTNGASGSGIYYRGQLIGVLLAVATDAGYVLMAADLQAVRAAVAVVSAGLAQSPCAEKY